MRPAALTVLVLLALAALPAQGAKPKTATFTVAFHGTAHYSLDEEQALSGCQTHVTEKSEIDWQTVYDSKLHIPLSGGLHAVAAHTIPPLGLLDLEYKATRPPCGDVPGDVMACAASHYRFEHPRSDDAAPGLRGRVNRAGALELSVESVGEPPLADPVTGDATCPDQQPVFRRLFTLEEKKLPSYLTAEQTVTAKQLRAIKPGGTKSFKVKIDQVPDHNCVGPGHPICDQRLSWTGVLELRREKP